MSSTRRNKERRVFQPPGRIDDDDDTKKKKPEAPALPPSSTRQSAKWQPEIFRPGGDVTNMDALLQGSASKTQMDALLEGAGEFDDLHRSYELAKQQKSDHKKVPAVAKGSLPSGSASKAHQDAVREGSSAIAPGSVSKASMDSLLGGGGAVPVVHDDNLNRSHDFERSTKQNKLPSSPQAPSGRTMPTIQYDPPSVVSVNPGAKKVKTKKSVNSTKKDDKLVKQLDRLLAGNMVPLIPTHNSGRNMPSKQYELPSVLSVDPGAKKVKKKKSIDVTKKDDKFVEQLDGLLAGNMVPLTPTSKDSQISESSSSTTMTPGGTVKRKKSKKEKKKKKSLEWTSNEVFVIAPIATTPYKTNSTGASSYDDGIPGVSDALVGGESPRQKKIKKCQSVRIENKEKLDTRWTWNQERVAREFLPYKKMLAEDDELLPNPDEFDSFQDADENENYDNVRDVMLEDGSLNEREIAAFFEGLALFDVKVKSLQSQLESIKAMKRLEESREPMRRQSIRSQSNMNLSKSHFPMKAASFRNIPDFKGLTNAPSALDSTALPNDPDIAKGESYTPSAAPRGRPLLLQKSLRAMSIRKIQDENKDDHELQRLLKELEEAEKKQKKLEKQIRQAGLVIAEDIPFDEAKGHVERVATRMQEIGSSEVIHEDKKEQAKMREEYFRLEQDMEKYNTALMMTDEYIEEQEEAAQKWEDDNAADNLEALKKLRRHMPVNVKSLSEAQLVSDESPNGMHIPKMIAKKFKRTNVLQLLRTDPNDIVRMHPSTLENLRVTGLTLTERRAIYSHLIEVGPRWKAMQAEQMTERKWTWYKMMKTNFEENLSSYQRHVAQYGPPGNHPYATRDKPNEGCPLLGKQCHLKADKLIDYDNDYGYTDEAEYEQTNVKKADTEDPGAKAMREAAELTREKKSGERGAILKKHYKGKLLQVSLANGSCESMDESIDNLGFLRRKWIEERLMNGEEVTDELRRKELSAFSDALNELKLCLLAFAERSGMQLTGKKDANADQPDIRSPIELGLSEEVCESSLDFFEDIDDRMRGMSAKDGRLKSTIDQLRELLDELHERNVATLKDLGVDRPDRSRKLKSSAEITRDIKKNTKDKEPPKVKEESCGPPPGGPPRGGLMAAIGGRGRGGDQGGRGGLMSALAGRGRGRDTGRGSGRVNLMSALAARGGGRGRGSDGRGDLNAALAARGRGGRGGMQNDLMAQLAARGRGRGRGGGGGGGFLAELQAKGKAKGDS